MKIVEYISTYNLLRLKNIQLFLFFLFIGYSSITESNASDNLTESEKRSILEKANKIQIPWIENRGQQPKDVTYYCNTFIGNAFLTKQGQIVYSHYLNIPFVPKDKKKITSSRQDSCQKFAWKECFVNGKVNPVHTELLTETKVSSFVGDKQKQWQSGLVTCRTVSLGEVWKKIQVKLNAYGNNIEKRFYIEAGGNVEDIEVKVEGVERLNIQSDGSLQVISGPTDNEHKISFTAPIAYQYIESKKVKVKAHYTLNGKKYGFIVGAYDHTLPLIIDPSLSSIVASTYLGGTQLDETSTSSCMAIDGSGNVYVTGWTWSVDYPTTVGAYQVVNGAASSYDVCISKLNSSLTTLLASTYLGGTGQNYGSAIALDGSGNIIVGGYTSSADFPVTAGAYQPSLHANGIFNGFVSKLNSGLTTLLASTYIGSRYDAIYGLALDGSNNIYVTGMTSSSNYPVTAGAYQVSFQGGNNGDIFISELNNNLTTLLASTYLGGKNDDKGLALTLDGSGNVYVTGASASSDYPTTPGAYQNVNKAAVAGSVQDAIVSKLNGSLTTLIASTLIGGSYYDDALDITLDGLGNVYIGGWAGSADYPTTPGAYQTIKKGPDNNAFVSKLDNNLTTLLASTFISGSNGDDPGEAIAVDASGNVFITGLGQSIDFPVTPGAYQTIQKSTLSGGGNAFVSEFNTTLTSLLASTFIGGHSTEVGKSILADNSGNIYVAGFTGSSDYPVSPGAYQPFQNGTGWDMFVTKLNNGCTLTMSINSTICNGNEKTLSVSGGNNYVWVPSASLNSSIGSIVIATPTITTTYTVTETTCGISATVTIFVQTFPLPTLTTSSNTTICSGNTTTLSVSGAVSYSWTPAVAFITTEGGLVTTSPLTSTTYTIIGTDNNGCTNTGNISVNISVNPPPTLIATPTTISICSGSSTMLSITGSTTAPPITYTWQPNTGLSSNTTPTITATPPTTTTYSITGTDANRCYNTITTKIIVNPLPTITINPINMSICYGTSTSLSASGANTYIWTPTITPSNTKATTITANPTISTTYTITGTDNKGCMNQTTANITINPLPIITTTTDETICTGSTTTLSASGAINYTWTPNTTPNTGQTVTATPNSTTTYIVTGTDQNGCTNTTKIQITTTTKPVVTISPNTTINQGETITISLTGNGTNYSWTPTTTLTCNTCTTTTATPTTTTTYYITTNNDGCQRTDSITITVKQKCGDIYVPNAFSPNGDNQNDVLYIKTENNNCIQSMTFEIYDRWGVKVFTTTDPNTGWDGRHKDQNCNTDVYVYNLNATLSDGSSISKKGNISLIR